MDLIGDYLLFNDTNNFRIKTLIFHYQEMTTFFLMIFEECNDYSYNYYSNNNT